MGRGELIERMHRWLARMTDEQLKALAADIEETMPEVADPRYDAIIAKVKHMLDGQEDAEGVARVLRERGCLREFLGR